MTRRLPQPRLGARGAGRFSMHVMGSALLIAALVTGCTPSPTTAPEPTTPTETSATALATDTPAPEPTAPVLVPDGTAADNLPLFAAVVQDVWAGEQRASGRAYIDALVAAGFDKSAMEVTEDASTVGNAAESIQFSVQWSGECLVGQVGPATGDPVTDVLPTIADSGCLVGKTRAIDW